MSIVCKSCQKDLYKSDGTGPFACPSCVYSRIEAVDSATGEPVELQVNGKPLKKGNSVQKVSLNLFKETRFLVPMPARQEIPVMLKLQSKHFRNVAETLNGVLCRFDRSGIALVAESDKPFIERWMDLVPNRVSWLSEEPPLAELESAIAEVVTSLDPVPDAEEPPASKRGRPKKKG